MITPFNIFVGGGGGFLIPYEDNLMLSLIQHMCQRGWQMLISYEDKWVWLHHLTYLLQEVVDFDPLCPYKNELMWLSKSTYLSEGVVDFWSLTRISWCEHTIQHICHRGWRTYDPCWVQNIVISWWYYPMPHELTLVMVMVMMMMIVSVEQRPGWTEHV